MEERQAPRGLIAPTFEEEAETPRPTNGQSFRADDDEERGGPAIRRAPEPDPNGPIEGRYLSAEEIFAIDDITTKEVWVPEWRTHIILITLTGAERDKYLSAIQYVDKRGRQLVDNRNSNARLLAMCAIKPDGTHLFNMHQITRLQEKNSGVIARLSKICSEMNGFGNDDDEDKERRQALD